MTFMKYFSAVKFLEMLNSFKKSRVIFNLGNYFKSHFHQTQATLVRICDFKHDSLSLILLIFYINNLQ